MSRTREEKLAEDLDPETHANIEDQYDLIDAVLELEPNDIVVIETHNDVRFAGEVTYHTEPEDGDNHTVDLDVLAYNGPDWQEDDGALIVIDYAGAEGSLEHWKGVPYTGCFPSDFMKDTWGDIDTMDVLDDADEAIGEVDE